MACVHNLQGNAKIQCAFLPQAGQAVVTPAAGTAAGNLASILMRCLKQDLYLFRHKCEYALFWQSSTDILPGFSKCKLMFGANLPIE